MRGDRGTQEGFAKEPEKERVLENLRRSAPARGGKLLAHSEKKLPKREEKKDAERKEELKATGEREGELLHLKAEFTYGPLVNPNLAKVSKQKKKDQR